MSSVPEAIIYYPRFSFQIKLKMAINFTATAGDRVLVVWSDLGEFAEELQSSVQKLQALVGAEPRVTVENAERLAMGE